MLLIGLMTNYISAVYSRNMLILKHSLKEQGISHFTLIKTIIFQARHPMIKKLLTIFILSTSILNAQEIKVNLPIGTLPLNERNNGENWNKYVLGMLKWPASGHKRPFREKFAIFAEKNIIVAERSVHSFKKEALCAQILTPAPP